MGAAENKALVEKIFARVAEADGSLFREHLASDSRVIVTGDYSWAGVFTGKESILRNLYGYVHTRLQRPGRTVPHRIFAADDLVVVEARGDMTTLSGEPYRNEYCLILQLRDGQIVEMREYQDSGLCERMLGEYPRSGTIPMDR